MKTLYLECNMGAAGDMIMSALLELVKNPEQMIEKLNHLGLEHVHVVRRKVKKCGITGTHVNVEVHGRRETSVDENSGIYGLANTHNSNTDHNHADPRGHGFSHSGMAKIHSRIGRLPVSKKVKEHVLAIYQIIAEAESRVHGKPVSQVHFHEIGEMDAIVDIVGTCLLMEELSPTRILASPIHLGSGFVRCAHGILPVPAPATAYILQGVPVFGGNIKGELCTPTGAAILKHFAEKFGELPEMAIHQIGYGMGNKDFEAANCIRAYLGRTEESAYSANGTIAELRCNLDDMTGEAIGFAMDVLFANGALDVFTMPIQMKKNRPGILFTCICKTEQADEMAALLLKHTTTFGVRKTISQRYMLERQFETLSTEYGDVTIKTGSGYGVTKTKPEYSDMERAAKEHGVNIDTVCRSINKKI